MNNRIISLVDVLEACHQPGCPICRVTSRAVERLLIGIFREDVNDVPLRQHLRLALGFCKQHAWQVLQSGVGDPLGVAIIYHDVLTNIVRALPAGDLPAQPRRRSLPWLRALQGQNTLVQRIIQAITPQEHCLACRTCDENEAMAVKLVAKFLSQPELVEALQSSSGLCLAHLRMVLPHISDEAAFAWLLSDQHTKLATLDHELAEFIRKNDYRFRDEPVGSERDSWQRAVSQVVGEK